MSLEFSDSYFAVTDGLRLHFRDYPGSAERPPLLCLHGLTRNARDFAAFAERYSPYFRVIALDFRGRGESERDPLPDRYTPLTYAADVQQLLDRLQVAKAIFVGTSLGGLVTMTIAALAPHLIAGAVLNDIGPELGQSGLDRIRTYVGKDERFGSWDEAAGAIELAQGAAFPRYSREAWLAMARRNCRPDGNGVVFDYDPEIVNVFTAGATPKIDLWPLFAALAERPLLVIRGELSELLSTDTFDKMRSAAPQAHFADVSGVGHAPMLDEPEAVSALDAFLAKVAP